MADDPEGRARRKAKRIEKRKDEKKNTNNKRIMSAAQREAAAKMRQGLERLNKNLKGK